MSGEEPEEGVDRRAVLVGIGVALVSGVTGYGLFIALGPSGGDDDGGGGSHGGEG
ncbi:hypothetical protein [Xylanimonas sp. McL0601]|uniref:hypothetical protein n=1 Tax=Xylanimonas sp. McL0601 TaxID=3414739 RepID=UPI003CE74256